MFFNYTLLVDKLILKLNTPLQEPAVKPSTLMFPTVFPVSSFADIPIVSSVFVYTFDLVSAFTNLVTT